MSHTVMLILYAQQMSLLCSNQGRNEVCGIRDQMGEIRDQKGEIRDQKGWIWDHGPGIRDQRPWDRDQQFFRHQGSGCTIFVGSGTKIGHAFGIKDQKFACKNRISDEKNIPRYHPVK